MRTKNLCFLLLVTFLIVGCSPGTQNPENTVQDYWSAVKDGNYEDARTYLTDDIKIDNLEEVIWDDDQFASDDMSQAFLDRIDLRTQGHTVDGETALVEVVIDWPNMELLLGRFMAEALPLAFQAALSGATEEEIELLFQPLFSDVLNDTPNVETPHEIHLVLIDGDWKISSTPIPDVDDVFNIPDFDDDAQAVITDKPEHTLTDSEPPIQPDEFAIDITIREPDSIGTVYMEATYTNNSQYPITGLSMTILLKDINEKTYLSNYDTVLPGETSPKFDSFGPETGDPNDYEILTLDVQARMPDGKTLSIEYDFKLDEASWFEY